MVIRRDKRKHIIKIDYSKVAFNAFIESVKKLSPHTLVKNPVMFLIWMCSFIGIVLSIKPDIFGQTELSQIDNLSITLILILTIFFSNMAENIAKEMGKAQTDSLRIVHGDVEVKKIKDDGTIEYVFSSKLEKGDTIKVQEGDLVPLDGEIIEGIATVDESAITGESSVVLKEPGTDTSTSVTGGTRVVSDWLLIRITAEQGNTYIDQMVNIAESIERKKTQNEISLNALLIASTISFLLVVTVIPIILHYLHIKYEYIYIIALLSCLAPTTIGGLVKPITISGFDKINAFNVLALTEDAIEKAGDINVLFLDKTGTITLGSRMAIEFIATGHNSIHDVAKTAFLASFYDHTPEGKSILNLAKRFTEDVDIKKIIGKPIEFSAHTRISGIDLENGDVLRKGASDAIKKIVQNKNGKIWENTDQLVENIASQGGTPLLISKNNEVIGLIHLKDIIKPIIKDKFKELNLMGIKTVMCTGDNNLTAKVIAKETGVNEYIAQAKPEEKINLIREYQSKGMIVAMSGDGTNDAPALAQADVALAMNTGTVAAKEASNMIDLDSDPTKIIEIVKVCRQLLMTKGALTTFSITNDISKYFAILPSIFPISGLEALNIMRLESSHSAIVSTLIFNAILIPCATPIAISGVNYSLNDPNTHLKNNLLKFGIGGLIIPFVAIKIIDLIIGRFI